jgi:hypothetical protein
MINVPAGDANCFTHHRRPGSNRTVMASMVRWAIAAAVLPPCVFDRREHCNIGGRRQLCERDLEERDLSCRIASTRAWVRGDLVLGLA